MIDKLIDINIITKMLKFVKTNNKFLTYANVIIILDNFGLKLINFGS